MKNNKGSVLSARVFTCWIDTWISKAVNYVPSVLEAMGVKPVQPATCHQSLYSFCKESKQKELLLVTMGEIHSSWSGKMTVLQPNIFLCIWSFAQWYMEHCHCQQDAAVRQVLCLLARAHLAGSEPWDEWNNAHVLVFGLWIVLLKHMYVYIFIPRIPILKWIFLVLIIYVVLYMSVYTDHFILKKKNTYHTYH